MVLWFYGVTTLIFIEDADTLIVFRIDPKFVNNPELSDIQVEDFKSEIELKITG